MNPQTHATSRLSLMQAAYVIARRDFLAILFSRAFFFFLLGPLFPVLVGGLAGSIGGEVQRSATTSEIGVAMSVEDRIALIAARERLAPQIGGGLPTLTVIEGEDADDPKRTLEERRGNYAGIVSGTLEEPILVGTEGQLNRWRGTIALLTATALNQSPSEFPPVTTQTVATSGANDRSDRLKTAQAGQLLLFLLTMLLAGMVLSNLVEEKANKIIEVLAAAIPMDAVFFGKLFAMLGVSFVGIAVWGTVGGSIMIAGGRSLSELADPAVGWPMFFALGVAYFAMAYLLLGSLFLTIGAMATTVREVQTLSMPVTMIQLMVFFLAAFAMTQQGSAVELGAAIFPLSSPFAMLARAALDGALWPHALALVWQGFAVAILVKGGATLFKRRVMKSGPQGAQKGTKRSFWRRRTA